MNDNYAKIGIQQQDISSGVYELVLSDYFSNLNPSDYGLDLPSISPGSYFITSGDAVEKARVLERDYWRLAGKVRSMIFEIIAKENNCDLKKAASLVSSGVISSSFPRIHEYEKLVWMHASQSRKLLADLRAAKGNNCFLETEWDDHHLLCIPKNPRK